eukprot:TRINITY_DN8807_c1_g1_i1.p1 TRINITY_DN8807_c1_g1~~TRINITY_DN8807_c1_g1_i1.p1  ORF type:complete len:213 (-),score=52.57 TRINITY_DN8807_c1_g1_i1:53-691(-)
MPLKQPAIRLARGVFSSSRTLTYKRRHLYKKLKNKKQHPKKQATETTAPKVRPGRLRPSLTPGTVVILLSGVHAGKRVVFLKQLNSGLLLITGPYNVNGVPIRRVNQAYVIATSTKIDIKNVKIPETLNDEYFRRTTKRVEKKKSVKDLLGEKGKKTEEKVQKNQLPEQRITDQKNLDSQITPLIQKVPLLRDYVKSRFSLRKGQFPHELKF